MKIGKVIMGMALIVLGILLISMFWQVIGAKTASEVEDDYDVANTNFKSYNAGDTVLIKDEIKDIKYDNTTKSTIIVFEGKNGNVSFLFKGELHPFLIGEYKKGDTVLIILKVEKKNNIEVFEGLFDANFTGFSSDKIHKLYLGGNAFFCVIILIGVLMFIYGLLKKKQKPMYYPPPAYPTQPMYPPPPQYQQPPAQQPQQARPMYSPQPPPQYPPPQYQQQPQQQYPSYQQPQTPQIQFQPAKKGLFQRLKKRG